MQIEAIACIVLFQYYTGIVYLNAIVMVDHIPLVVCVCIGSLIVCAC